MTKVQKGCGGTVNMWSLNQKVSRLVFVKPNIAVIKYGRAMEIEVANIFIEFIKRKNTDIKLSDCGLFVDETLLYLGARPDRILLCCSCCEKVCVEIKCPCSINYTKPCYSNSEYLRLCDGKTVEKVPQILHTVHVADDCYWNYKKLFCCLDSPWNDH